MFEVRRTALWAGGATAALAMGLIVLTAHLSQPSALLGRSAPLRFSAIDTEHRVTAPAVHQADASAVDDAPPVPYSAAKMADDPPLAVEIMKKALAEHKIFEPRSKDKNLLPLDPRRLARALHMPVRAVVGIKMRVAQQEEERQKRLAYTTDPSTAPKKGGMSMSLAAEEEDEEAEEVVDMKSCNGKWKGCAPLAKEILAVSAEIERECLDKFFDSDAYYKCEATRAIPLCNQAKEDFPKMCAWNTDYTTEHGYIGSEEPASIHAEFCKGCEQIKAAGCFAASSLVTSRHGQVAVSALSLGDEILSADAAGARAWTPVMFLHDHPAPVHTTTLSLASGAELSLTGWHPVYRAAGQGAFASAELVPAGDVKVGDRVFSAGAVGVESSAVTHVSLSTNMVRYVVTGNDRLLVGGVLASAQSTMLGAVETLPFKALYHMGLLAHPAVSAALKAVLDSPALSTFEHVANTLLASSARPSKPSGFLAISLLSP